MKALLTKKKWVDFQYANLEAMNLPEEEYAKRRADLIDRLFMFGDEMYEDYLKENKGYLKPKTK